MQLFSKKDVVMKFENDYNNCTIRYGDMKKQLAEDIVNYLTPFREKILDIYKDNEYLKKVVNMGTGKARESASKTLKDVREIIGFKSF